MENRYDIDLIIAEAIRRGYDIAPKRMEWVKLCQALKVLGYDETYFVALCLPHGTPERESRCKWREEKRLNLVKTENQARAIIAKMAKDARMNLAPFLLSHDGKNGRARYQARRAPIPPPPAPIKAATAAPAPPPYFLPMEAVRSSERRAEETGLFKWMAGEFGEEATRLIFGVYHVGASKHTAPNGLRANSFPYINAEQKVVDCKLFHIDPATGSRQTAAPIRIKRDGTPTKSSWAIPEINYTRRVLPELNRAKWCNFGDHLLPLRPSAEVCLVESEKTALIAALTYPDKIWIAVGSKSNLTAERCATYIGRKVTLFPDRDGYNDKPRKNGSGVEKGWRTLAKELTAIGLNLRIDTTTERHPGGEKDDIADIITRFRHGAQCPPASPAAAPAVPSPAKELSPDQMEAQAVWNELKRCFPQLANIQDLCDLEIIGIEHFNPAAPAL